MDRGERRYASGSIVNIVKAGHGNILRYRQALLPEHIAYSERNKVIAAQQRGRHIVCFSALKQPLLEFFMQDDRVHSFLQQQLVITGLGLQSALLQGIAEPDPTVPEAARITDRTDKMLVRMADSQQMIGQPGHGIHIVRKYSIAWNERILVIYKHHRQTDPVHLQQQRG
ncbi:hypothetical protein D3C80_1640790 [compost metagenome]